MKSKDIQYADMRYKNRPV